MGSSQLSSKRSNLWGVVRLTRPGNLAIAAATMCTLKWGWLDRWPGSPASLSTGILMIAGTAVVVLLMAAGNLINAYFDVDEDRINRPERALVDRVVKRRVLILTHQVINALGIIVAIWLAFLTHNLLEAAVAVLISFLLWRYSARWKGRPIVGNFVVAALLAAVPLWLLLIEWKAWAPNEHLKLTAGLGTFAFFALAVGWMREMVKDALDIEGDRSAGKNTWAVLHGPEHTRRRIVQGTLATAAAYILLLSWLANLMSGIAWAGTSLPAVFLLLTAWSLRGEKPRWHKANQLLKWTLVAGFAQALWLPAL